MCTSRSLIRNRRVSYTCHFNRKTSRWCKSHFIWRWHIMVGGLYEGDILLVLPPRPSGAQWFSLQTHCPHLSLELTCTICAITVQLQCSNCTAMQWFSLQIHCPHLSLHLPVQSVKCDYSAIFEHFSAIRVQLKCSKLSAIQWFFLQMHCWHLSLAPLHSPLQSLNIGVQLQCNWNSQSALQYNGSPCSCMGSSVLICAVQLKCS